MIGGVPSPVRDEENLARFVLSESWLYKDERAGNPLRPNAWIPHPRIELSVFRTSNWTEDQVATRGHAVAAEREGAHRQRMIDAGKDYPDGKITFLYRGRGEIFAGQVRSTGLDAIPKEPPPHHADIVNWPPLTGNRKHDEASQLSFALKLQTQSRFVGA